MESSYVADTTDDDGDGVPNTWDAFPGDGHRVADWDGDGYADRDDAFPLDATRHAPTTTALVTPNNKVRHYWKDVNANWLGVDVEGAGDLKIVNDTLVPGGD